MPSYLVVGASRGLGYEWLRYLSSDPNSTVVGIVRNSITTKARLASDKINNVSLFEADMVDHVSLTTAAADLSKIINGSLDFLIINGAYNNTELATVSPSMFQGKEDLLRKEMISSLEVNVLGVMYSINAFLPLIRKGVAKKIVAISTGMADPNLTTASGNDTLVTYSTMKAALNMVVAKYAAELRGEGITLLALSPGVVNTKEEPPTPEEFIAYQGMVERIKTIIPDWKGPITPAESVMLQKQVIDKITIGESGAFLSHFGNKTWV